MKIYLLSCQKPSAEGGIYTFDLNGAGELKKEGYYKCDRPMYAVKCERGLCVILREPFENRTESGYFFIDEDLKNASEIKDTGGEVACHLSVIDEDVYIANYKSGSVSKNGKVSLELVGKGIHPIRQTSPHAHFVGVTPDGYTAVCDLGTDALTILNKDFSRVSESKVPSGYGIRHIVFSKDGKFIYAVNELVPSISVFSYKSGEVKILSTQNIDCKEKTANGGAIRISDDGKYIYVSVRDENVICVYETDGEKLTLLQMADCGGNGPRDFKLFNNCLVVCNQKSGEVISYRLKGGIIKEQVSVYRLGEALCVI